MRINWEGLGVAASVACAIHCAVVPLFITSLPLLGVNLVDNPGVEFTLLLAALVIGLFGLWHGFRLHHHKVWPMLLFVAGIGFMAGKEMMEGRPLWMLIPSLALILGAHYLNHKLCRKANHCHENDCNHDQVVL